MIPDLGMIFVSVNQWGMGLTAWEKKKLVYKPGDLYMGVDYQMYRMGETIGHVKAIDIASKKVVWDYPSSLPSSRAAGDQDRRALHRRSAGPLSRLGRQDRQGVV
jgi:hypothetical protein